MLRNKTRFGHFAARQDAEKLKKQMDKWKLEGEDADWFPGFSAKGERGRGRVLFK